MIAGVGLGQHGTPTTGLSQDQVSCHGRHKRWIRIGISLLLCLLCLSVALLACFKPVQLHNKPAVNAPPPEYQTKNRKPLGRRAII